MSRIKCSIIHFKLPTILSLKNISPSCFWYRLRLNNIPFFFLIQPNLIPNPIIPNHPFLSPAPHPLQRPQRRQLRYPPITQQLILRLIPLILSLVEYIIRHSFPLPLLILKEPLFWLFEAKHTEDDIED